MEPSDLTRRNFIKANVASLGLLTTRVGAEQVPATASAQNNASLLEVDFERLVSRSDLVYLSPAETSDQGQPIGNGHMGTMVWTTPNTVEFQINRADVFASNSNHLSQFADPCGSGISDFCGACAKITIDVGGTPFVTSEKFEQQLSVYGAESHIQGVGVQVRCFVAAQSDILVLEIDDQRPQPGPLIITLGLWGPRFVQEGEHVSRFNFANPTSPPGLTRTFTDRMGYYCSSAVAIGVANQHVNLDSETDVQQTFSIKRTAPGKTQVLIASAASMDPKIDATDRARRLLERAASRSYKQLRRPHRAWWSQYWARTFVYMSSADQIADFMERLRTLHLYLMASASRGAFPTKWNGMTFLTQGDQRRFGSQYWGWTMETPYLALSTAGAFDISDPYFNMYVAQLPKARTAARQRWGGKGAYFSEIVPFDGSVVLPDDVAQEYRDVILGKAVRPAPVQPGEWVPPILSERARSFGQYDRHINDFALYNTGVMGSYTQNSHVLSAGPRIALHAWWRYRCSGDKVWLRTHAYPLLRDTSEFYRSYAVKREDGRYHIEFGNVHESFIAVHDGIIDMAAIRGLIPVAIRAAEILNVDADLCESWREFVRNVAPYSMGRDPGSHALGGAVLADDVWSAGHVGADPHGQMRADEDSWINPIFPFEDYTLERRDPEMARIAAKVVELSPVRQALLQRTTDTQGIVDTAAKTPIAVARIGWSEKLSEVLCGYYCSFGGDTPHGITTNTFDGRSIEHLGVITMTLQDALIQSLSPTPGAPEIIRLFPAWPANWDGAFSLVARGAFLVTSMRKNGVIPFVEIESRAGETCRIRNPWNTHCFLAEVGKTPHQRSDDIIQFDTKIGKKYRLFRQEQPAPIRVAPTPRPQASLTFTWADGKVQKTYLGKR